MLAPSFDQRCPNCRARLTHVESVWNIEKRTHVRIFECGRCSRLIWEDSASTPDALKCRESSPDSPRHAESGGAV
jgi:hypothetical protein